MFLQRILTNTRAVGNNDRIKRDRWKLTFLLLGGCGKGLPLNPKGEKLLRRKGMPSEVENFRDKTYVERSNV